VALVRTLALLSYNIGATKALGRRKTGGACHGVPVKICQGTYRIQGLPWQALPNFEIYTRLLPGCFFLFSAAAVTQPSPR